MPYPVVHVLFFMLCISAVAIYATLNLFLRRELSYRSFMQIILLLFVGGFCSLFPDIIIVYNLLVNGTMEHSWVGSVPTHSLLFSSSAILFGTAAGYAAYRDFNRAAYLGLFAEAAFLSHLLLDEVFDIGFFYLYPIYNEPIRISSIMDIPIKGAGLFHYLSASFLSVFFICFVMMMALFALNQFGFEFKYKPEK